MLKHLVKRRKSLWLMRIYVFLISRDIYKKNKLITHNNKWEPLLLSFFLNLILVDWDLSCWLSGTLVTRVSLLWVALQRRQTERHHRGGDLLRDTAVLLYPHFAGRVGRRLKDTPANAISRCPRRTTVSVRWDRGAHIAPRAGFNRWPDSRLLT